jgi:hypothetical protein
MGPDPDPNDPTPGMHIWGWMSPTELTWLGAAAAQMDSVVEIGCLHGRSAFALLTACPGPVFCIDPWNDAGFNSFMSNCGHFENLHALREASPHAATNPIIPDMVDMVFIDGDHHYQSVVEDIEAWAPRTRKMICGHDYYDTDPKVGWEVKRAVDEKFGPRVHSIPGTSIWAVRLDLEVS